MNWKEYWKDVETRDDFITRYQYYLRCILTRKPIAENIARVTDALDIGCTGGHYSRVIAGYGVHVDAIDELDVPSDTEHISYHKTSIQSFHPNKKYGLVLLCEVIEHIPESQQKLVLQKIRGLLAEHGTMIYTAPNWLSPCYGAGRAKEIALGSLQNPHYHLSYLYHLDLLKSAGFKKVQWKTVGVLPMFSDIIERTNIGSLDAVAAADIKASSLLRGLGANFYAVCEVA